jgi:hypothetical protein
MQYMRTSFKALLSGAVSAAPFPTIHIHELETDNPPIGVDGAPMYLLYLTSLTISLSLNGFHFQSYPRQSVLPHTAARRRLSGVVGSAIDAYISPAVPILDK